MLSPWQKFIKKNYKLVRGPRTTHLSTMRKLSKLYQRRGVKSVKQRAMEVDFEDGERIEKWLDDEGRLDRADGPAYIQYYENGNIQTESWYLKDDRHRDDGPASINYYQDGKLRSEFWYLNGRSHRDDGPASISYSRDGKLQSETWYVNGVISRVDGPALREYENGKIDHEVWYLDYTPYRADGPAEIYYYENGNIAQENWYTYDGKHRDDGPAVTRYYEDGTLKKQEWWTNGEQISYIEYNEDGSVKGSCGIAKLRKESLVEEQETCKTTLEPTDVSSKNFRQLLTDLFNTCNSIQTSPKDDYVTEVHHRLMKEFDEELTIRNARLGHELEVAAEYGEELVARLPNLFVKYEEQMGVDAGGLRKQFFSSCFTQMKDKLFTPIGELLKESSEDVPRYFINPNIKEADISAKYGVDGKTLFKTAGYLFAHAALNLTNTRIPLSRSLLRMMLTGEVYEDKETLLYYLLDSNATVREQLRGIDDESMMAEYEEYLTDQASSIYFKNDYLTSFLEGFQIIGKSLNEKKINVTELYRMIYQSEIDQTEFVNFLQKRVSFSKMVEEERIPLSESEKQFLIDRVLLPLGDYPQILAWWSGEPQIRADKGYLVTIKAVPFVKSHTCFNEIDLSPDFLNPAEVDGLTKAFKDTIYNMEFSDA